MTQALPDILTALSKLIPDRVRAEMGTGGTEPWVYRYEAKYRSWKTVYWGGDWPQENDLSALEYALRGECEARGWTYGLTARPHPTRPSVVYVLYSPEFHSAHAATSAHALSLALLGALNAAQAAAVAADRQAHPESKFDVAGGAWE